MRHYFNRGFYVAPQDLIAFAWSAPMRDLAAKIGISDVGLRKLLTSNGIFLPPQGHWNRVHAGRTVPGPPKPAARRPGETGLLWVDDRFTALLPPGEPISADGPFASAAVPEHLEELRARELKAIGRAKTPKTLELFHPGLRDLLKQETRRREKALEHSWHWDEPKFDNALDQRKLRLLNGIFLTLAKRGHSGSVSEHDGELRVHVTIGDTGLPISLEVLGKHRTVIIRGVRRPAPDLPATTPLALQVKINALNDVILAWEDDEAGKLETKIAEIAAGLIVAGEARFRRRLREEEVQRERERHEREAKEERERVERERLEAERIRQLNVKRVADLQRSGELLRLSQDIRSLVVQVREAMAGHVDVDDATLLAWQRWALDEADKLDPILSGQVLLHLRPPS
jgi:hypothetical protein